MVHGEKDPYKGKLRSVDEAMAPIRSGQHVFVGSGAAEPQVLVDALARRAGSLADVEVLHLLTLGSAPYVEQEYEGHLRHNALFIGPNVRGAVAKGLADYTPCCLSEVPGLILSGRLPVDVALIQTTPPRAGACSLGVSVDVIQAAIQKADYVIAQVNPRMPWTEGESLVSIEAIDVFIAGERPIAEPPAPDLTAAALWIGHYVSHLIEDGSTIQVGIGAIPNSVLAALAGKKDLGIHSEMISDGILALLDKGVVTGRAKNLNRGKIVASFCMGSERLYQTIDRNPTFEFRTSDYVNDPAVIAAHDRMVAVNSALQVDLTGQIAADSLSHRFFSGVGGQVDFMRGAARSKGGRSIIALPSTAKDGAVSRITTSLGEGTGVVSTRADVDFVVTEYGIASLKGKTIRERAIALIQVAHPDHRAALIAGAKRAGYLPAAQILPPPGPPYPADLETKVKFQDAEVFFRPLKPSDVRRLKDLFYRQSMETTYLRFGIPLKSLNERQFQELAAIDFRSSMAIAGFVNENGRERMIAVGRYYVLPGEKIAETALTVEDIYQGQGIGSFLLNYLCWIGKQRGLEGLRAEVVVYNPRIRRLMDKCFNATEVVDLGADGASISALLRDWKGTGNPALRETEAHA